MFERKLFYWNSFVRFCLNVQVFGQKKGARRLPFSVIVIDNDSINTVVGAY